MLEQAGSKPDKCMSEPIDARHIVVLALCCLSAGITIWITISALLLHIYVHSARYDLRMIWGPKAKPSENSYDQSSDSSIGKYLISSYRLKHRQASSNLSTTSKTQTVASNSSLSETSSTVTATTATSATTANTKSTLPCKRTSKTHIEQLTEMFRKDSKSKRGCISSKRPSLRMFINALLLNHAGNLSLSISCALYVFGFASRIFQVSHAKTCSVGAQIAITCQCYGWCCFQLVDICRALQIIWNKSVIGYFSSETISTIRKWITGSVIAVTTNSICFLPFNIAFTNYEIINGMCNQIFQEPIGRLSMLAVIVGTVAAFSCNGMIYLKISKNISTALSNDNKSTVHVKEAMQRLLGASLGATSMTLLTIVLVGASMVFNLDSSIVVAAISVDAVVRVVCSSMAYKFRYLFVFSCISICKDYNKRSTSTTFYNPSEKYDVIKTIDNIIRERQEMQFQNSSQLFAVEVELKS